MAIKVLNEICADKTFYSPPFGKHSSFHIRFFCHTFLFPIHKFFPPGYARKKESLRDMIP